MNFGIGLLLKVPETVPFRMTELVISPLGALREKGMFNAFFVATAMKFDTSDANIWKAMGYF
jgi:phosphatidylinositol kinase/protein kinase (PI-3  family)